MPGLRDDLGIQEAFTTIKRFTEGHGTKQRHFAPGESTANMNLTIVNKKTIGTFFYKVFSHYPFLFILLKLADRWGVRRSESRVVSFPFFVHRKNSSFQILYYHRVNDVRHPFFAGTRVETFSAQMEQLRKHFCVLPLEELVYCKERREVPDRAVAITFDDGYKDNFSNAFPILKELGLPATIFLTTGTIDSKNWLWHDQVFEAFRHTQESSLVVLGKKHSLRNRGETNMALRATLAGLRQLHPKERDEIIDNIVDQLVPRHQTLPEQDKLSWDEVRLMSENQITFGAHTVSHPILTRLSLAEAYQEIMESKETIEKQLNAPVRLFAYPNGGREDFNASIKDFLRRSNFLSAVTTIWGTNDRETDLFELRRVSLENVAPSLVASSIAYYKFAS